VKPKKVIGLSGFGDAIYIEPLVRKLVAQGNVILYTNYKQVLVRRLSAV